MLAVGPRRRFRQHRDRRGQLDMVRHRQLAHRAYIQRLVQQLSIMLTEFSFAVLPELIIL